MNTGSVLKTNQALKLGAIADPDYFITFSITATPLIRNLSESTEL